MDSLTLSLTFSIVEDDGGEGEEGSKEVGRLAGKGDPRTLRGSGSTGH